MKAFAPFRYSLFMAAGLALSASAAPAQAANEARAPAVSPGTQASVAQLNEEGAAFYTARDYRRAIEKFIQAYAIDSDPNLLFNIARCYEELGEVDAAIEKYENFLKTPGADTRGRQRARESLAALRESRQSAGVSREAAPAGTSAMAAPTEASQAVSAQKDTSAAPNPVLPWVTLGGSVLFAAVGTTFYFLGAADHSEVTDARGFGDAAVVSEMTRREADELVSSGDTKKLIGGISFGVAGALAATYVVLLVTGEDSSSESPSSLGFSLEPSPAGAAASVQGSF